ncbi:hypothetical protein AB0451_38195 [Streptomyces sp. NPDC052000]|uniref:hypothetical protein n=1 Tax=Streptomyces sp. NPDC052000 TaxID=3155676 RepID=UPI00344E1AA1
MGDRPAAAAIAVATSPTASDIDAISRNAAQALHPRDTPTVRFGMPHALVIIACIATAAILTQTGMSVAKALELLAGAGAIGATILIAVHSGGARARARLDRLRRAYRASAEEEN